MTLLQYVLPGDGQFAVLAFTTTRERFAQNQAIFERAAHATRGTKQGHPALERVAQLARPLAAIVIGIAGVVALLMFPWKLRKAARR